MAGALYSLRTSISLAGCSIALTLLLLNAFTILHNIDLSVAALQGVGRAGSGSPFERRTDAVTHGHVS